MESNADNQANHAAQAPVPNEEFIRAFTQAQRPLFLYLLPLLGTSTDPDDVLQETNLVIWAKWRQFQPGTNFLAWSRAIARLEVFRFRRKHTRKLTFLTDELLDVLAQKVAQNSDVTILRQAALAEWVTRLRPDDRKLIQLRYSPGANGDKVASKLGRPANSVYQSLGRIRRALMQCVQLKLKASEAQFDGSSA